MEQGFLIDTNIAIYFLGGVLPSQSIPFINAVFSAGINLSVITQIELLGWQFPDDNRAAITAAFVERATLFPLDEAVVKQTIVLRRNHKVKLPDAIIAATAIVYELTLLSRNDKDFLAIPGLFYRNPFS